MGRIDNKVAKKNGNDAREFEARSSRERISLDDFVHRKGQVRALEEFRYRKQRKKVQTAKALRSYRKVMKKEGYEAGQGASRKRIESSNPEVGDLNHGSVEETRGNGVPKSHKRRHKMNPFQKSVQKAEKNVLTAKQRHQQEKQNEKQRLQKLQERKQRTKLLNKRTKRGQPIMKHMVDNLLQKLEKQHKT